MKIKTEVLILDCPEISCPRVLRIVFRELCGAFVRMGVGVREVEDIKEVHDDAIVFMGDFFHVPDPCRLLAQVSTEAIYIGWYWQKQDTSPLPHFLHVYENVLSGKTLLPDKVEMKRFMDGIPNSCPLLLRANEDPEAIGTYPRTLRYDYCFMGGRMCEWLVPRHRFNGYYFGTHNQDEYMSYDDRRSVYLASAFALGFQTDDNVRNGHVSQRIFEAMAYGCVVLSNSLHASIQTDGIVEYVDPINAEKFAERMDFFLQNPHYMEKKRQQGYEFVRRSGTNDHAVSLILNKLSALEADECQTQ